MVRKWKTFNYLLSINIFFFYMYNVLGWWRIASWRLLKWDLVSVDACWSELWNCPYCPKTNKGNYKRRKHYLRCFNNIWYINKVANIEHADIFKQQKGIFKTASLEHRFLQQKAIQEMRHGACGYLHNHFPCLKLHHDM